MAISIVMPALEMAQETGKLLAWRKKEGEPVKKGEPLLEIETDKAVVEIEAPGDGILAGVRSHEGAVVPVGQTIAWLVAPGEQPPRIDAPAATARTAAEPARSAAAAVSTAPAVAPAQNSSAQEFRISPKARRLAKEHGVDPTQIQGTGPDGIITTEDVMGAVNANSSGGPAAPALSNVNSAAPSAVARLMAERTTQSWTSVPHFFVVRDIDTSALKAAHKTLSAVIEKVQGTKSTITDILVALTARALEKHPIMNASWTADGVRFNPDVNISLAMAVTDGVVAAVIPKANQLSLGEIATKRLGLTERARAGRLQPADIFGGTFTISNLGMYKVDSFTAIITPPQAAILAIGAISDRVVAVEGKPVIRPIVTLSLSTDHRVTDGARAASFMGDLADAIADPEKWLK